MRLAFGFLLLLLGLALQAAPDDTLRRGNGPEPSTLDAHRAQDIASHNILRDLYCGLVTEDAGGQLIPGMAERWEVHLDGHEYRFFLRANLRWSNGEALSAQQIRDSFERALAPETAGPLAPLFDALRRDEDPASSPNIEVVDARTLVFHLRRPAPLLKLLTLPPALPIYLPAIREYGNAHTRPDHLVSNGAYRLQSWEPHASIVLARNPNFFDRQQVAIEHVQFLVTEDAANEQKRFLSGDLDITETVPPARLQKLRERFGTQLRIHPYLGSFFLGINLRHAPLGSAPALREALSLSIDRDILTRYITALGEHPAYGLVPSGIDGYRSAHLASAQLSQQQREQRARELLTQWQSAMPRENIEVEIRYNTSTVHRRLALAVAAMWRQTLGIKVRLRNEEWKSFVQNRREGRITQIFRGGWIGDLDDPSTFLSLFSGDQALNWSGWHDDTFDHLLRTAEENPAQRLNIMRSAEQRLLDQHVIIPIYFYTSKHLVADRVQGYVPNLLDRHASRWIRLNDMRTSP